MHRAQGLRAARGPPGRGCWPKRPLYLLSVTAALPAGLKARLATLFPGSTVLSAMAVGADTGCGETGKQLGYGSPLRVALRKADGVQLALVFHVARADDYGHDRRSDRAAEQLLAWDSFPTVPGHARAVDVGAIAADGGLVPLPNVDEFYLLTEWADGEVYAEDLRRVDARGAVGPLDLARAAALARWLAALHRRPGTHSGAYVRAWRDLVGSGEGIAGIVDGYGAGAPGAPPERLSRIEAECLRWRQRHKQRTERLRKTHGDFHPFNIVFAPNEEAPILLDASRGSEGEPADDVGCLAINFLFFALEHRERWKDGLGRLWHRFWEVYLEEGDRSVLEVVAPFFAWRGLVVCSPAWYPHLREADRDRMLRFVERVLAADRFDPAWGDEALT